MNAPEGLGIADLQGIFYFLARPFYQKKKYTDLTAYFLFFGFGYAVGL
jgi:hypothetical protein